MHTTPLIDLNEIHSFTDFLRNAKSHTKRLKKTGKPSVLTVKGRAELVIQDAQSYQEILKQLAELEDFRAVRRGIADMKAGRGQEISPNKETLQAIEEVRTGKGKKYDTSQKLTDDLLS